MNLKVTFLLILAILLLMIGAGGVSAYIGYVMGTEALKVVTQPEGAPEQSIDRKKPLGGDHKGLNIIDERKILINAYDHVNNKKSSADPISFLEEEPVLNLALQGDRILPDKFPIRAQSEGVTIEIIRARKEIRSVALDVSLQNKSDKPIRFLYSFLDVRDEQNRPISAIVDGLPGELPPNERKFRGTFIIPNTLLEKSQTISLSLQDYPDQKINLQLDSVPVAIKTVAR